MYVSPSWFLGTRVWIDKCNYRDAARLTTLSYPGAASLGLGFNFGMMSTIIHTHLYDPTNSLFGDKKGKAFINHTHCSNHKSCGLYERGQCCTLGAFPDRCPYGKKTGSTGFTRRARKFYSWVRENKEKYQDTIGKLRVSKKKMALVGAYVYLPYSHMNMNKRIAFISHAAGFASGSSFVPAGRFGVEEIKSIIKFRPNAMMGGEIKSYQKESVPNFIRHLKEVFPDLYEKAVKEVEGFGDRANGLSYVGKQAFVISSKPGTLLIKKHRWVWDGCVLESSNYRPSFFMECSSLLIKVMPNEKTTFTIESDDQYHSELVLKD